MRLLNVLLLGLAVGFGLLGPAIADTVKITVNDSPITDVQIAQRARLLELERRGNNNTERAQLAQQELITETLQLNEAQRLGITITDAQVSTAFLNVARNLKVSAENLTQIPTQNGVNVGTLRGRLKASIAWAAVARQALAPTVRISDLDLEIKAAETLSPALSFDCVLKEVLFLMPGGQGNASTRAAQANQYRSRFNGCDNAVEVSLDFTDAAVINIGRRHATQLPEALAGELAGLNVGDISRPRVVERGVSMMAVCSKAVARDTTFIKNDLRQEAGNELLREEAVNYLNELRTKARIVYI